MRLASWMAGPRVSDRVVTKIVLMQASLWRPGVSGTPRQLHNSRQVRAFYMQIRELKYSDTKYYEIASSSARGLGDERNWTAERSVGIERDRESKKLRMFSKMWQACRGGSDVVRAGKADVFSPLNAPRRTLHYKTSCVCALVRPSTKQSA